MLDWEQQIATMSRIRQKLPNLLWRSAGVCRQQSMLDQAIAQIQQSKQEFLTLPISQLLSHLPVGQPLHLNLEDSQQNQLRLGAETQNLIDISFLLLKAVAFRQDYPQTLPSWQLHTLVQGQPIWISPHPSPLE